MRPGEFQGFRVGDTVDYRVPGEKYSESATVIAISRSSVLSFLIRTAHKVEFWTSEYYIFRTNRTCNNGKPRIRVDAGPVTL